MLSSLSLLIMAGLLLLALAMLLLWQAQWLVRSERVVQRLGDVRGAMRPRRGPSGLQRLLLQAGLKLSTGFLLSLVLLCALVLLLVYLLMGLVAMVVALLSLGVGLRLLLQWRYQRRVSRMVQQLPVFLDHIIRSLKSGRSLGDAMLLAIQRSQQPLQEAFAASQRALELGLPLDEVLADFAELYGRREFHIMAVSVKVNQRYGGNASELFNNLITLVRDRERAAGQLRALTGETRISAWVLGSMPILIGAYIFISNPGFLLGLWNDETGRMLLLGSLTLQGVGCYILYRMLRSI